MRLICPSCGAQYEVDDAVIPEGGRDVQCSACGHAWFEAKPLARAEPASAGALTPEPEDQPEVGSPAATPVAEAEPEPVAEAASEPSPAAPVAAAVAPPETETRRRTLDEAVLNVLREEAEREERARLAEGLSAAGTQPDLGLVRAPEAPVSAPPRAEPEPERVVHLDTDPAHDEADGRGSRRGLLPDIEEINSTLAATNRRSGEDDLPPTDEMVRERRSGFRRGFSVALVAMVLLLGLYVLAPSIAARVPATEPALAAYVARVDALRLWLDARMRSSAEAIRGDDAGG
jgi:predicted Zn finger-like uncharacterized protein